VVVLPMVALRGTTDTAAVSWSIAWRFLPKMPTRLLRANSINCDVRELDGPGLIVAVISNSTAHLMWALEHRQFG
jgi:hypothetical protein